MRSSVRLPRFGLWLAGCVAVGAALRLFRLGHQPLWIDELISLQLATYADGAEFWRGLLTDIHGPFNSVVLRLWVGAFGVGEAAMRTLYVLPAVATIPLAGLLGRELLDERAGRGAALVLALSPFHVWYSQEVRSYAWAILWVTAGLWLFLRVRSGRDGRRVWGALAAVLALAVLTNFSAVFLLLALSLVVASRRPFDRSLAIRWAGVLAAVGLVFLPWFLDWYGRIGGGRLFVDAPSPVGMPLREDAGFSPLEVPYAAWSFVWGYTLGPSLRSLHLDRSPSALLGHLPVLAAGGLVAAVALAAGVGDARARGRLGLVAAVVGVPLLLAVFLAARDVKTFHPRYLVASFPVIVVLLGSAWSRPGAWRRATAAAALVLVAVSLSNLWFSPAYAKEDSRAAARLVLEREEPGDSVVVIYAFRPFRHYYADLGGGHARLHHLHKRFLRTDDEMRAHVAEAGRDASRVWLVLSRWWDVAPEEDIRRAFEETLRETDRWEFPGVKVTLYEREAS